MRAAILLAPLLVPSLGVACPCGAWGVASRLTAPGETYGVALTGTSRVAAGRYDAGGRYRAFEAGESEDVEELALQLAARPLSRWEASAELGVASYRLRLGDFREDTQALGDAILRVTHELTELPLPHEPWWWPGVAASGFARLPLGEWSSGSRSMGDSSSLLGLGTWELGGGASLDFAPSTEWMLGASVELGLRVPDHTLGERRVLGPRVSARLTLLHGANASFAWFLATDVRVEGSVSYAGREREGTEQRAVSGSAGIRYRELATGFRSGVSVTSTAPLSHLGVNTTHAVSLAVSIGLVR